MKKLLVFGTMLLLLSCSTGVNHNNTSTSDSTVVDTTVVDSSAIDSTVCPD